MTVFAQLGVDSPSVLLALLAAPAPAYFAWCYGSRSPAARWFASATTIVIFSAAIIAMAMPCLQVTGDRGITVFVLDRSASAIDDTSWEALLRTALENNRDKPVRFVSFAGDRTISEGEWFDDVSNPNSGSNIQSAVASASTLIPSDAAGRIVLISDGAETTGQMLTIDSAVPVDVFPLHAFSDSDAAILHASVDGNQKPGDPFPVRVTIASANDRKGELRLSVDGRLLVTKPIELAAGFTETSVTSVLEDYTPADFELELVLPADSVAKNNRQRFRVYPAQKPSLLLVHAGAAPNDIATTFSNFEVTIQQANSFTPKMDSLANHDMVILNNVAASVLDEQIWATLQAFVNDHGGGLIVTGNGSVFSEESLASTPLEALLPVTAAEQEVVRKPTMALLLVIDNSDSMVNNPENEDRLSLAKAGAKRVVELLGEADQVGLLAFNSRSQWVSQIEPISSKEQLLKRIDALDATGATNMYPAMQRANLALKQTIADRRHLLLLTDGVSTPGDFREITKEITSNGITISTITVGAGADQSILRDIARIAGGKHRHCDNTDELADLVVAAAEEATSDVAASEFRPFVFRALPGLDIESAPPFSNYTATRPRPDIETLWLTPGGRPLLSWRRMGRGITMAFTSNSFGEDAAPLRKWEGFASLWQKMAMHACRKSDDARLVANTFETQNGIRIQAELRRADRQLVQTADVNAIVTGPDGQPTDVKLAQAAPGRFEANLPADQLGRYDFSVSAQEPDLDVVNTSASVYLDTPRELQAIQANHLKLEALASRSGGKVIDNFDNVFECEQAASNQKYPIWHWFLLGAIVLLVVNVAIRKYA